MENYDYSDPGEYFVTICTKGWRNYFGKVVDSKVELSGIGKIANKCWQAIPNHFPNVVLDEYVVMPNHVHGIVVITDKFGNSVRTRYILSLQKKMGRRYQFLPIIIGVFKSAVTRNVNAIFKGTKFSWQRSYYDHIIQTDEALDNIREYVELNPFNWRSDWKHLDYFKNISGNKRQEILKDHYKSLFAKE